MAFWHSKADGSEGEESFFSGLGLKRLVIQSPRAESPMLENKPADNTHLLRSASSTSGSSRVIGSQHRAQRKKSVSGKSFDHYRSAIAEHEEIIGHVHFELPVRIDGNLQGSVFSSDILVIGPEARIKGEIKAKTLIIQGAVHGDVDVSGSVMLHAGGTLEGAVNAPRFAIDEGSVFNGSCTMRSNGKLVAFPGAAVS